MDTLESYYESLNQISSDELFDGFLGYGLFAEKIPNFLSSKSFLSFCKSELPDFRQKNFSYVKYENTRNINIPRTLAIPNPFAYFKQCKILKDHWDKIKDYFKDNTEGDEYKISRVHIRKIDGEQYIFESDFYDIWVYELPYDGKLFKMNYKVYKKDGNPEQKIVIGKRYLVKTDISNCFGSIYTHAIPWALACKEIAKQNRNKMEWYNQIDEKTRWLNNNETHGILIGPHTSNLISEIILVAVDSTMSKKYKYVRKIDDYSCYVETKEDAEKFLLELSQELKKYGLSLNHKKTEITELPTLFNSQWARKLKQHDLIVCLDRAYNKKELGYEAVSSLMELAIELTKENDNNAAILNYAIKILLYKDMNDGANEYFVDMVHHLVLIYPYLVFLLEDIFDNKVVYDEKKEQISNDIYNLGSKINNYELMSYALYFALKYKFKFKDINLLIKKAEKREDCIFMLLCYLYDKKYNNNTEHINLYKKMAKKFSISEGNIKFLNDEFWLFAYEVLKVEEPNFLDKCCDWKKLKERDVTFIKDEFLKICHENSKTS
ncbi:RNA-directed DNA polymerase [Campylobacter concisus]|uniref:RNA-directed DNA polymerase n=1 Tax=Campylobacter concisus TaxID=199 RepID=UPI0015D7B13E|nr:RNA-directed DNA polymerase [Campylobacter concisus]